MSFDTFWTAYPLKRGKAEALKVWKRDKLADKLGEILAALEAHKRLPQWQKDNGQYIPHASTWLNKKRYEDELESDVPGLYGQAWAQQPYKAG